MTEREKVILAYERGYRVTDDGKLIGMRGKPLFIKDQPKPGQYPSFSPYVKAKTSNGCVTIHVHRFAAYCFYGDEMYQEGIVVRHLNASKTDISKSNIVLGTYADNEADKGAEKRSQAAIKREANKRRKKDGCTSSPSTNQLHGSYAS